MAEFTPGPWSQFAESGEWWIAPTNNPDVAICGTLDTNEADVDLICAAPDLLFAIRCLLANPIINRARDEIRASAQERRVVDCIDTAHAAVRKATGVK